jgi:tetratricopeptide (TPR) repeat protein
MLNNLAQIYCFESRYADAEKAYLRAIGIWEQSVGAAHPDLAGCLLNYAALLRKVHRKKEAAEMEARAKQALAAHGQNYSAATLVDWHELQRH